MTATRPSMPLIALALTTGFAGACPAAAAPAAPQAAVAGIRAAAPSIAVDPAKIEREVRGHAKAFEYAWEAGGRQHEVVVTADGQLLVEEHQHRPHRAAARVLAALRERGLTATAAERVRVEVFEVEVAEAGEAAEDQDEGGDDDADEDADEEADERERFFLPDGVPISEAWLLGKAGKDDHEGNHENQEGMQIKPGRLPAAVRATLVRVLPGFKVEEAEEEGSGAGAVYSVEGEAGEHDYEIRLDAHGGLLSLEREGAEDDD